jgi:hypothetical protein
MLLRYNDGPHVGDFYAGYGDSDLNKTQAGFDLTGFREGHAPLDVAVVAMRGGRGLFSASEATIGIVALLAIVWYFGRSIGS